MKKAIVTNFHVCSACKGKKSFWKESHDCWGKDESYRTTCYTCGGNGFVIGTDLKKQIEKALGI